MELGFDQRCQNVISEFLDLQIVTSNPKFTECNECQAYANAHLNQKWFYEYSYSKSCNTLTMLQKLTRSTHKLVAKINQAMSTIKMVLSMENVSGVKYTCMQGSADESKRCP